MASNILSGDQLNFTRMGIASVDEIKVVLADILRCEIKPQALPISITSCSELMTGRHKLRPEQQKLCCPSPPGVPDYNKFGVSLLYTLIRNLCPRLKPTQDWGKTPSITDLQVGDDIERLREFRNQMFAHLGSSSVEDVVFTAKWRDLENIFQRIQTFLNTKGISVDYGKKLATIARSDFGFDDMEKYKIILKGILHIFKESYNNEIPKIVIHGGSTIMCGETAYFEADIKQTSTSTQNWPITWHRVRGNNLEQIDTSTGNYTESTNRQLVIQRTSKEDHGDYKAIISGSSNGQHINISSNVLTLKVTGELPILQQLEVTSGKDGIALHYKYDVSQDSPHVHHIAWSKNGDVINIDQEKYLGGDLSDTSLTITSPSIEDKGEYNCIIANAVGVVAESLSLGIPKVSVLAPSVCYGENTAINSAVSSCPPAEKAMWEKSLDAVIFETINVGDRKYSNSILDPSHPVLKLTSLTFDDKLYYRLRVWNSIGEGVSNTVLLKVTGDSSMLSTIFSKKGSSIRFNNLKLHLIREISEKDLKSLKSTLTVITSMESLSLENILTVEDFFKFLLQEGIFKERNVIMMQYLMRSIKRPDLELKCVEYATKDKQAVCYFEETKVLDGCTSVKLHLTDDDDDHDSFEKLDFITETVAQIVDCNSTCIEVSSFKDVKDVDRILGQPFSSKTKEMGKLKTN